MSSVIKTCTKALENTSTSSYTDRTDYQSIELKTSSSLTRSLYFTAEKQIAGLTEEKALIGKGCSRGRNNKNRERSCVERSLPSYETR